MNKLRVILFADDFFGQMVAGLEGVRAEFECLGIQIVKFQKLQLPAL